MELCVLAGPLSFQFSFCIRRRGCGHGQSGCGEILKVVEREMERGDGRGRKEVREGEWGRGKEVEGSGENDYLPSP